MVAFQATFLSRLCVTKAKPVIDLLKLYPKYVIMFKVMKMKTLGAPNERSYAINKKTRLDKEAAFRLSGFVISFEEDGVCLMKNILTGEVISLSREEYQAAIYLKDTSERYEYLEQHSLTEPAMHRFIVEKGYNEAEQYLTTVKLIRIMQPESPGLKTYTILPTTGCNARCTYCYEEGYPVMTMTRSTADRLIDYICETRQEDSITLSWFGGEPLVCADTISYICRRLTEKDVPFTSRMITNASLVTRELAREMKDVWKLQRVQVSLDGDRRDYTERKRYLLPEKHNYDQVMEAIGILAEADIQVVLRVNFDSDSFTRLRPFLVEMKERFGSLNNVKLYLSALYQEKTKPRFTGLTRQMFELGRYVDALGLNSVYREQKAAAFRLNSCMADSIDKSVVIDPEGRFYNCEHLPEGNTWGNIFDGITDRKRYEELLSPAPLDDKCRSCAFLPQCTTFYKNGCPGWFEGCRDYQYLKTEYELRKLADIERAPQT